MDVLVIGCGVSGLTTGLCLLEAGHTVTIWAKDLPPFTTSNIAAAFWYPYKAYPPERVFTWARQALHTFKKVALDKESGVIMTHLLEFKSLPTPDPWWATAVEDFHHLGQEELPPGYRDGYTLEVPVIDTLTYLHYLVRLFKEQKGQIFVRTITSLAQAFAHSDIVINCTGLGAQELLGDHDLRPARGQIVRIKPNGFKRVLLDDEGSNSTAYIVPRLHDIVLGGTYEEQNDSLEVDPVETLAILERCRRLSPAFAGITADDIVSVACGLRPVRSTVRLEVERLTSERLVVHNYGHGGAGVTLSWGCAFEVTRLLAESFPDDATNRRP